MRIPSLNNVQRLAPALAMTLLARAALADVVTDGSLGPALDLAGPDYEIPAELGTQRGGNLFHSFDEFSLHTIEGVRESATFTPEGATGPIDNVLARVTGGSPSEIDGTLRSTIPDADLYFLNPSGIVFGPNARLDLPGSFHASTADRLEFGDGQVFEAREGGSMPLLTVASPLEFGFLGANTSPILVEESASLAVGGGEAFSMVGAGDVRVAGSVRADSTDGDAGGVTIRGGTVALDADVTSDSTRGRGGSVVIEAAGEVTLRAAGSEIVTASADSFLGDAGSVTIRGATVAVEGAFVSANSGAGSGGSVTIESTGDVRILANEFRNWVSAGGSQAGSVSIRGGTVAVDRAMVRAETFSGRGGSVLIEGSKDVRIRADGFPTVSTDGGLSGDAGRVEIRAPALAIERTHVSAQGGYERGNGGEVILRAGSMRIEGVVRADAFTGNAGTVAIEASGAVTISSRLGETFGLVSAESSSGGYGGQVLIRAGSLRISGVGDEGFVTYVAAGAFGGGNAGRVEVHAGELVLDEGLILADTDERETSAGSIQLVVDRLRVTRKSMISASSLRGAAGSVDIVARESIVLSNPGGDPFLIGRFVLNFLRGSGEGAPTGIFSVSAGPADSGTISVSARDVEVSDGAIVAVANLGTGRAGDVVMDANTLRVTRGGAIDSSALLAGAGGSIQIDATEAVEVTGSGAGGFPSRIRTLTLGKGAAGSIAISAPQVVVDGGVIATATADDGGQAGGIRVLADRVTLRNGGRIDSSSFGPGAGGTVLVAGLAEPGAAPGGEPDEAERIEISGVGSRVSALASGAGEGGDVVLLASAIEVVDGGSLGAESVFDADQAETIFYDFIAGNIFRVPRPSSPAGDGGSVRLHSSGEVALRGGSVTAGAEGSGVGGNVDVLARRVALSEGSTLAARSDGPSDAGSVTVEARDGIRILGSDVTVEALAAEGGDITLAAPRLVELDRSQVTASVRTGEGGNVRIDPALLLLADSTVTARAAELGGRGGRIEVAADLVLATREGEPVRPESLLDASAPGGPEFSGTVEIRSPDVDLAGTLAALPASFLDASSLLRERCTARGAGEAGSFTVRGATPAPPADGYLPAPLAVGVARRSAGGAVPLAAAPRPLAPFSGAGCEPLHAAADPHPLVSGGLARP